jgi:hypothetical protein
MATNRTEETRWRRIAMDLGYRLESSHRHDSRSLHFGSYRLVELRSNRIVLPEKLDDTGYGANLDEVAKFLRAAFRAQPLPDPRSGSRSVTRGGRHRRTS